MNALTPPREPGGAKVELCAFRVGDEEYVIDLRRVREIVHAGPITPVPRAPPGVEGVMSLRDSVIPVVDVRKRLGVRPRAGGRPKVLVVDVAGRVLGLGVDGVLEVVRTTREHLGPPPVRTAAGLRLFLGVCGPREPRPAAARAFAARSGRKLRLLLNVKALLEPGGRVEERPFASSTG